ncbi:AGE family epimerase/isomerase [Fulvivirgaceae bacterium BMA12]|uniref:AGE family epimerase/isomerase n=1 Tax=Agaribacillus aureus TaxID=3051825 RepID=A0ABT8LCJ6_9BACT|nr:AGE family epimerase/isomerase [Fulvivirgaceae bacterium BMA12]
MKSYKLQYHKSLWEDVIPFWEKYSPDYEKGGYFTCLDAQGQPYDTDKFVWLQARQVWLFSTIYMQEERRDSWLEMARLGAEFLRKHVFDPEGQCYFSLDHDGKPLMAAYNIFSDCFVTMAFAIYAKASGESYYADRALSLFDSILERADNPKGKYNKAIAKNRPLKGLSLPMILCNLTQELAFLLPATVLDNTINNALHEVLNHFLDVDRKILFEHVLPDGAHSDTFEGRLINPGHGLETSWFLMDIGERLKDADLISQMIDLSISLLEFGWDEKHGGIFYFMDEKGHPPQQLEWDQKLWWVHLEALVALAKGYRHSRDPRCLSWFEKVHHYTWQHFPDSRGGLEWYGYLNRQGEILLNAKGGKWKGCFHVPRGLYLCEKELGKIGD